MQTVALLCSGIAAGAFGLLALALLRSEVRRDARLTTVAMCLSAAAWVLTTSGPAWIALGRPYLLLVAGFPVAGLFWAFVVAVFQDRQLRWFHFAPAGLFLALGLVSAQAPSPLAQWTRSLSNLGAAAACLHAGFLIVRSWRGDLVDSRRAARVLLFGAAALFAAAEGLAGATNRLDPGGAWAAFSAGGVFGAAGAAALAVGMGLLLLEPRAPLFAIPAAAPGVEAKLQAIDRSLLAKLDRLMAEGAWRREGLGVGTVARELGVPEHRLRKLINGRMGHRNFAEFLNRYRIEAAKLQLADPDLAHITVAAIAFDLGYGSLSPFNRAFRAVTGSTPTQWRSATLAAGSAPVD